MVNESVPTSGLRFRPRAYTQEDATSRKQTQFADERPLIELTPIEVVSGDASPEQPSSPKLKTQPGYITTEKLISIFKSDNKSDSFKKFRDYYKAVQTGPNSKLPGLGRPYIIQALTSTTKQIFIYLLRKRASLDVRTDTGKSLTDYVLKDETQVRLAFLKDVHKSLLLSESFTRISSVQGELHQLEKDFLQKLKESGINKVFKGRMKTLDDNDLSKTFKRKDKEQIKLVRALYDLCTGIIVPIETIVSDPVIIKKYAVGLIVNNKPRVMVAILKDLYPHFQSKQQKLMAFFIIKELIILDSFHSCYHNKQFCDVTLPAFLQVAVPDKLDDLHQLLKDMIKLRDEIDHPFVRAASQIETIISKCDSTKPSVPIRDPKFLADELRAMTSQFLRSFKLTELVNQAWSKENKLEKSPTVVDQFSLFNKISDYFVIGILQQPSEEDRMNYIKMCVKTLDELINGNPCDLQSANAMSFALENIYVTRYLDAFVSQDSQVAQIWKKAQNTLEFRGNYSGQRKIMADPDRTVFPWLGIYTKDLTFIAEVDELKTIESTGKIFLNLIRLQDTAREHPLYPKSNLHHVLHTQTLNNTDFQLLAMRANPRPIRLDEEMTLPMLKNIIEIYITKQLTLRVIYEGQKEGPPAIDAVFSWIKENVTNSNIKNLDEINKLTSRMEYLLDAKDSVEYSKKFMIWLRESIFSEAC